MSVAANHSELAVAEAPDRGVGEAAGGRLQKNHAPRRPVLSMGKTKRGQFLEREDVMRLLRSEIERAGGQIHWAKIEGVSRPHLNKMLQGTRQLSKSIIKALKLRIVYAPDPESIGVARDTPLRSSPSRKASREKGSPISQRNSSEKERPIEPAP